LFCTNILAVAFVVNATLVARQWLQMKHFLAPIPLFADWKAKVALNRCFDYNQQSICSRYTTNKFSTEIFLYFLYKNNTLTFALEI